MRVLHIHSGNLYGGIETYLIALAQCRQLCPEMQSEFVLCFSGRLDEQLQDQGAIVHSLGEVRVRYPWTIVRARRALQQLFQQNPFDVAVCHSAWPQAIFGPVVRRAGVPNVFYLHGRVAGRHWLELWARHTRPNYAICNSLYTQNSLARLYPGLHSQAIYLPVSPGKKMMATERMAVRSEFCTPLKSTVIIQVSRMEGWKGHVQHLEALAELRDNPDWVAWIVGGAQTSSEQKYLSLLKERTGHLQVIDQVRFVGQRNDVARLLGAADIFCQPNLQGEPFGISFVEALYAGLPVVTTDIGGAREVVDETCGILVPTGNTLALSEALRKLISSRVLRAALGQAAMVRANKISDPRTQLTRLHQVLCEVVVAYAAPLKIGRTDVPATPEGHVAHQ